MSTGAAVTFQAQGESIITILAGQSQVIAFEDTKFNVGGAWLSPVEFQLTSPTQNGLYYFYLDLALEVPVSGAVLIAIQKVTPAGLVSTIQQTLTLITSTASPIPTQVIPVSITGQFDCHPGDQIVVVVTNLTLLLSVQTDGLRTFGGYFVAPLP